VTTRADIARRVGDARRLARLTQEAVEAASGIGRSAISDIERGSRNLTATELVPLAAALGCSVGQLLGIDTTAGSNAHAAGYRDGWRDCAAAVNAASAVPCIAAPPETAPEELAATPTRPTEETS
jgi:transcriptional regulator with XRE-family HTH domain